MGNILSTHILDQILNRRRNEPEQPANATDQTQDTASQLSLFQQQRSRRRRIATTTATTTTTTTTDQPDRNRLRRPLEIYDDDEETNENRIASRRSSTRRVAPTNAQPVLNEETTAMENNGHQFSLSETVRMRLRPRGIVSQPIDHSNSTVGLTSGGELLQTTEPVDSQPPLNDSLLPITIIVNVLNRTRPEPPVNSIISTVVQALVVRNPSIVNSRQSIPFFVIIRSPVELEESNRSNSNLSLSNRANQQLPAEPNERALLQSNEQLPIEPNEQLLTQSNEQILTSNPLESNSEQLRSTVFDESFTGASEQNLPIEEQSLHSLNQNIQVERGLPNSSSRSILDGIENTDRIAIGTIARNSSTLPLRNEPLLGNSTTESNRSISGTFLLDVNGNFIQNSNTPPDYSIYVTDARLFSRQISDQATNESLFDDLLRIFSAFSANSYEDLLRLEDLIGYGHSLLSQATVDEHLKSIPFTTLLNHLNDKCPICLTLFKQEDFVRELSCKHVYHQECIDTWLTGHRNSCPLCRRVALEDTTSNSSTM